MTVLTFPAQHSPRLPYREPEVRSALETRTNPRTNELIDCIYRGFAKPCAGRIYIQAARDGALEGHDWSGWLGITGICEAHGGKEDCISLWRTTFWKVGQPEKLIRELELEWKRLAGEPQFAKVIPIDKGRKQGNE